jgi:FkbM family methyltransferase
MINKNTLLQKLSSVERLASTSKLGRLLHHPIKYGYAIVFKEFIYPKKKLVITKTTKTFYNETMHIDLPAATDIYLTGGKSHSSEIRLAKFMILNINEGSQFLDIGAHYGYFALLAATLVGNKGMVYAFEPSVKNNRLLHLNCSNKKNITVFEEAISEMKETLTFYEFPNLYSEYNSMDVEQFKQEPWFQNFKPERIDIQATTIDNITQEGAFIPALIKIDVEGAEYKVIKGADTFLQHHTPILIIEYVSPERHNEAHKKAVQLLVERHGYKTYTIQNDGSIKPVIDLDQYLHDHQLESDNIVFKK